MAMTNWFRRFMEKMVADIEEENRAVSAPSLSPESRLVRVHSYVVEYAAVALEASSDSGDRYAAFLLRSALDLDGAPKDPPDTSWVELEDVRTAHPYAKKRRPLDRTWVKRQQVGDDPS